MNPLQAIEIAVILLSIFVLLMALFHKKGERKPVSRFVHSPSPEGDLFLEGPAWQVMEEVFPGVDPRALCKATCCIYRSGGIHAGAIATDFFGPYGPGTAIFAQVKIGNEVRSDLFVGSKPLKGSTLVCPVNWQCMVLTCVVIDPKRGLYRALLEMTEDEARRHGDLIKKIA